MSTESLDPLLVLGVERARVEPGQELTVPLRINNPTTIVERYTLDLLGPAAEFATIEPASVSVLPGATAEAAVRFTPRRVPAPPAGPMDFGVRCRSEVDASASTVLEGQIEVGGFRELVLELAPVISKGWRKGRHRAVLTNRGNLAERVRLVPTDPAEELRFTVPPVAVEVPASGRTEARVIARARATFWKGAPRQHRFEVTHAPVPSRDGESAPPSVAATFTQRPIISGWMMALFGLAVVIVVIAVALAATRTGPESALTQAPDLELDDVEIVSPSSVRVVWSTVPGAAGYLIERSVTDGSGGDPLLQEQREAGADAAPMAWDGLPPGTEQCFRFTTVGPAPLRSALKCVQLPPVAPFAAPTGVLAQPVEGSTSVQVQWTASEGATAHIVLVDGSPAQELPGTQTQLNVEPGERCFSVVGKAADGALTEPAPPVCVLVETGGTTVPGETTTVTTTATTAVADTTAPPTTAPSSTSPPTGGSTGSTETTPTTAPTSTTAPGATTTVVLAPGWFVLLESLPVADRTATEAEARAKEREAQFDAAGIAVDLARSEQIGLAGGSWVVYVDGLASRDAAVALCRTVKERGLIAPSANCIPQQRRG